MTPGQEFDKEIEKELNEADIILLLISSSFLDSFYCYDVEMKRAMARHEAGTAMVVPVLLSDCVWQREPFAKLVMGTDDAKPLDNPKYWNTLNEALTNTALNIERTVERVKERKAAPLANNKKGDDTPALIPTVADFPKPSPLFTGREQELQALKELFRENTVLSVEGLGGIGKTELVAQFIHEAIPDKTKVLWLNGNSESKLEVFIEEAGYSDLLKASTRSRLALYSGLKDLLERDARVLFLDNFQALGDPSFSEFAGHAQQYGRNLKIVLITKVQPQLPMPVPSLPIEGLKTDSLAYAKRLRDALGQRFRHISDEEIATICEVTDGHPLAIQLAMQLLTYGVSADSFLREVTHLQGRRDVETLIRRLFLDMYEHASTTEEERVLLTRFSVFNDRVPLEAIHYIAEGNDVWRPLMSLIDKFLINREDDYYSTHPLIRELCHEMLEDKKRYHNIAANYYTAQRKKNLNPSLEIQILYHFQESSQIDRIETEIVQSARQFISMGQTALVSELVLRMEEVGLSNPLFHILKGDINQINGDWDLALENFQQASKQEIDNEVKIEGIIRSGEIYIRKSNFSEALPKLMEGRIAAKKYGYQSQVARAINDIGLVQMSIGTITEAETNLQEAYRLRNELGIEKDISSSLLNIANIYLTKGDIKMAQARATDSLLLSRRSEDKINEALALGTISKIHGIQGNIDEAIKVRLQSLSLNELTGNKAGTMASYCLLSSLYLKKGKIKTAVELVDKSNQIALEIGDKAAMANILAAKSDILRYQNNYETAIELQQRAVEIAKETEDAETIAIQMNNLAVLYSEQNHFQEAIAIFTESSELSNKTGYGFTSVQALYNLGAALAIEGKQVSDAVFKLVSAIAKREIQGGNTQEWKNFVKDLRSTVGKQTFQKYVRNAFSKLDDQEKAVVSIHDFLDEPVQIAPKTGRNEPCPCGSGKKYKACHGKSN